MNAPDVWLYQWRFSEGKRWHLCADTDEQAVRDSFRVNREGGDICTEIVRVATPPAAEEEGRRG